MNTCCGTTLRVVATAVDTGARVGYLDCHNAKWLGALLASNLIFVQADADCIMHFIGAPGVPVAWIVHGDVARLAAMKDDAHLGPHIANLCEALGADMSRTDSVSDLSVDTEELGKLASSTIKAPPCSCTQRTCFLTPLYARRRGDGR